VIKAIAKATQSLDIQYFPFLFEAAKSKLSSVFLYSMDKLIFNILQSVENKITPGDIDSCLVDIMDPLIIKLANTINNKRQRQDEMSVSHIWSIFRFMGQFIDFKKTTNKVLRVIDKFLEEAQTETEIQYVEKMLSNFADGLTNNPSVNLFPELALLSYKLIKRNREDLKKKQEEPIRAKNKRSTNYWKLEEDPFDRQYKKTFDHRNGREAFIYFALSLFFKQVKNCPKEELIKRKDMLDPFVPVLLSLIDGDWENIRWESLKVALKKDSLLSQYFILVHSSFLPSLSSNTRRTIGGYKRNAVE